MMLEDLACAVARRLYEQEIRKENEPSPLFCGAALTYMKSTGQTRFLRPIIAYFGPCKRIDEITPFQIQRAGVELSRDWRPETIRRQVEVPTKAVINHAKGIRRVRHSARNRTRWLTPEELEVLLNCAANSHHAGIDDPHSRLLKLLAFLIGTGVAPGEAFAMNASHQNRQTNEFWVAGIEVGAGKTLFRPRWVIPPTRCFQLMDNLPNEGRLFLKPNGQEYPLRVYGGGQARKHFNALRDAAGLSSDVVPYTARHSWATYFSVHNRDHDLLLDRGGWADTKTARIYRKQAPSDLEQRLLDHGWDFRQESGNRK
jgi:integrase